jgi:carboxy-terminal domain RNA polymerase II polypeptide A small phosphatase
MDVKPLLILDLNGTLVLSEHRPYPGVRPHSMARRKYIYFRPNLRRFLQYAFRHFRVAVWSSNSDDNVAATVEQIFTPEQRDQLVFAWGRSHCETPGEAYGDYKSFKRVDLLVTGSLAGWAELTEPRRVVIVDDTSDKIVLPLEAALCLIESYVKPNETDKGLMDTGEWLSERFGLPHDYL